MGQWAPAATAEWVISFMKPNKNEYTAHGAMLRVTSAGNRAAGATHGNVPSVPARTAADERPSRAAVRRKVRLSRRV